MWKLHAASAGQVKHCKLARAQNKTVLVPLADTRWRYRQYHVCEMLAVATNDTRFVMNSYQIKQLVTRSTQP